MRRREFITSSAVRPLGRSRRARSDRRCRRDRLPQQPVTRRVSRCGGAFRRGLGEAGFVEGQNCLIARSHLAADAARPRRRGDRMSCASSRRRAVLNQKVEAALDAAL